MSAGERRGLLLPRRGENIVEQEHGHIATHSIAKPCHTLKFVSHGLASCGIAVIELDGISPGRKVRVFAVGKPTRAAERLMLERIGPLRRALDEEFGPFPKPGMIVAEMIWNEVENQFDSVF